MADHRPICEIALEISKSWEHVTYSARPYISAMLSLNAITDRYIYDDAKTIIRYFLANATTWRGVDARRIKAELRSLLDD